MRYSLSDPAKISSRAFDDEVVVAHFGTGVYYSLLRPAADIWLALMAGLPVDQVAEVLAGQSEANREDFLAATHALVRQLEAEGLIAPARTECVQDWQPMPAAAPFGLPAVERFTDMQDLLLLDPIHDVGEAGWPHEATSAKN
jgi:hypothetical protein